MQVECRTEKVRRPKTNVLDRRSTTVPRHQLSLLSLTVSFVVVREK